MPPPPPTLSAPHLAELAGVRADAAFPEGTGVAFHSARVRAGDVFFALPGNAQHGLAFAEEALGRGAAFIVSDRPHPRGVRVPDPAGVLLELGRRARGALQGAVVGITGSAGKTSTKAMVAAALHAPATPGNFNTPPALAQTLVAAWLEGRTGPDDKLVLELGIDHRGEMDTLVGLTRPDLAVLTLIAPSHLEGLGDVENVAREKLKLVAAASHAFVSAQAAPFLSAQARAKSTVCGLAGSGAEVEGVLSEPTAEGGTLEVLGVRVRLPFVGRAMAQNAVLALALAAHLGVDLEAAARRLEGARLEPGRLQVHKLGPLTLLDDAYNSNPASARAALEVLSHFPRPHAAVLGDMLELGAHSQGFHRDLGRQTRGLERVVAVGPEMRALAEENPGAVHLDTFDLETLRALLPTEGTLLVKGSRGTRLERLVQALLEDAPA